RSSVLSFAFTSPSSTPLYSLSLHDALPISTIIGNGGNDRLVAGTGDDVLIADTPTQTYAGSDVTIVGGPGHCTLEGGGGTNHILDRKSTRLNSSHVSISYAVFCLKKKTMPS